MMSLIFALSASSALALQYKPWEEHNTNTFTFQAELHPPTPSPWYTATLNYTDQDDLQMLSRDFAAAHGGDGDGTENELGSAVENELSRSTGWHSVYDLLGLQDHPGKKLLLLPIIESGLGRRLLYVASAAQLAEALGRRLVVLWAPGEHCKASYFDLFAKAPPGVTVVSVPSAGALVHLRPSLGVSRDAHLPPAEAAPVVFAPELFGAHQNATGNRLPAVPIVRVAGSALGPRALTAGRALKASLVSLDHDSGAQFGVFGTPIGEWRARCHDLLSSLRPSRKVGRLAESLVRRTTIAMETSVSAAAAATGKDGTSLSSTTPTRVAPPPSLLLSGVVGIHARRDQPGVDAPILLLPPTLGGGGDGEWTLAGWSEVPLARYVDVALAVANRKQADRGQSQGSGAAVFAVFSNDEAFAQQLAEEINRQAARSSLNNSPPAVVVVLSGSDSGNANTSAANDTKTTSAGPTKGATARAAQFTSRDVEGSVAAAAEWFALSRCGLVVGAQRSEFMRTASLRSQAMASVEVVPRTGVLVAGGALDLAASSGHRVPLVPCSLVDYGAAARVGREWGVEEALCTKNMPHATIQHEEQNEEDDDKEEEEGGEGEGIAGGRVLRRLHIGRTTGANLSAPPHDGERDDRAGAEEAAAAAAAVDRLVRASLVLAGVGEWTVVDVVGGLGVDLVVEGMHSLRLHSTASASTDAASTSFSPPPPPPPPPPLMLAPHSFSHVYASHVLEHGGWQQGAQALREWRRVLKRGGALSLAVPDTAALAGLLLAATSPRHVPRARGHGEEDSNETYDDDDDDEDEERDAVAATVLTVLYGAQRDLTDYHRAGYTETILRRELEAAGFCGVVRVKGFHRFSGDSTTLEVLGTPISLNLEAVACGDLSQ